MATSYLCSPAARRVLAEFGGLELQQYGPRREHYGGFPRWFFLEETLVVTDRVHGFIEETGIAVFPVGGNEDGPSCLVVDPDGRMLMFHLWAGNFFVGSGDEAIRTPPGSIQHRAGPARPGGRS